MLILAILLLAMLHISHFATTMLLGYVVAIILNVIFVRSERWRNNIQATAFWQGIERRKFYHKSILDSKKPMRRVWTLFLMYLWPATDAEVALFEERKGTVGREEQDSGIA